MKPTTFILLLAVVLSACAPAVRQAPTATPVPPTARPTQDPKALAAELDAILQKSHQAGTFDGSVLVARNGQVILSQGYGFADRFKKTPNTPQTKFRIGSLTKQFTAMAILTLQAEGKLNVQDKLCAYLSACPEILKPITLHHLLTHTSGLPNATKWNQPGDKMLSKYATLNSPPGDNFSYTDVGYNLAGKIIETVSGRSYEAFMQQNIFEPLQMSSTGYDHEQADLAKGYAAAEGDIASSNLDWFAAGALYSTVEDLYRYDQALYTDKLLPQSALSAMFSGQVPVQDGQYYGRFWGGHNWRYGYGWFIRPDQPRLFIHGGQPPGFRTEFRRYPDDKVTIIILCNHEAVMLEPAGDAIAAKLLGE
jgi:CubicO group peptidase (beta-lactamase class C family)